VGSRTAVRWSGRYNGNDEDNDKYKYKYKYRDPSLRSRMTTSKRWAGARKFRLEPMGKA
jgi:hypothetical protein